MNYVPLQEWIEKLLLLSDTELCRQYEYEEAIDDELGPTHLSKSVMQSPVDASLLLRLYQKLHGLSCEGVIWNGVVWYLDTPLPLHIAHDFMDREVWIDILDHSIQHDEIMWRLVRERGADNPLLTMAKAIYTNEERSLQETKAILREVLNFDLEYAAALNIVAGWDASSPEKEAAFLKVAKQHPLKEEILLEHKREKEKRLALERLFEQIEELTQSDSDIECFDTLYKPENAQTLLWIAQSEDFSPQLLQKLTQFKKSKWASKIRAAAKSELWRRQKANICESDLEL